MKFKLEFDCDGAAFEDSYEGRYPISDALKRVSAAVTDGLDYGPVLDGNGNTIGSWDLG